jgi:hypothetical protein|tara:strand:+ start:3393 stop:4925 length:1533 start_codon:yes stop_codon:yes gene_type:complete
MKKLIAGPFVGEFGWELFCWQGVLRTLSKTHDKTIIYCRPGMEKLYLDFADEIITYLPPNYEPNCHFNTHIDENIPVPSISPNDTYIGPNTRLVDYTQHTSPPFTPNISQEFIKFGEGTRKNNVVLIHARSTNKVNTGVRNWPIEKWEELVNHLIQLRYIVISIGSKDASSHIKNTEDKRGVDLDELANIMSVSTFTMGPSSGPLHLAALCGSPIVVWSGSNVNQKRYENDWNPFKVKVRANHINWNPSLDIVKELCSNLINPPPISILAVLVNYGDEQLQYLEQVVKELKSFKKYNVSIVVNSNIPLDIEGIDQVNVIELNDYQLLPLTCRQVIWDHKDDFDVFLFGENDHLFKEHHIDKYLKYTSILPDNRISGLIQYEENKTGKYYPAYHANYEWDFDNVEEYEGLKFAHFTNIHQATFILTKEQLHKIGSKYNFTQFFGQSHYSSKCKVNTDIYQFCGMKKMICVSEFGENLIHHLPNIYINGERGRAVQRSDEKRMNISIKKLLT